MQLFSLAAVALYCLASLVVGTRLVLLSRRTHARPELLVGSGYLVGGMLGFTTSVAGGLVFKSNPALGSVLYVIGQVGMAISAGILIFAWQYMFAPKSTLAKAFATAWSVLLIGIVVAVCLETRPDLSRLASPWYLANLVGQLTSYTILAVAIVQYSLMLRRRAALGLADPVVANRMLFWGIAEVAVTVQYFSTIVAIVAAKFGTYGLYSPGLIACLGIIGSSSAYIGFVTRTAGVGWLRGASAARAEG